MLCGFVCYDLFFFFYAKQGSASNGSGESSVASSQDGKNLIYLYHSDGVCLFCISFIICGT